MRRSRYTSRGAARGRAKAPGAGASFRGRPPGIRRGRPGAGPAVSANRRHGFAGGARPYDYAAYEREPATPEYLERLLRRHGLSPDARQLERFWLYYDLLRRRNAEFDLTRIMGVEATALKHFVDSAIVLRHVELRGPVLDIGSGPGFPGAPIAVMRPDLPVILAESRGKRVTFLEELLAALRLDNAAVFPHSVRIDSPLAPWREGEAPKRGEDGVWTVRDVVTRALETISPTLERTRHFVPEGGRVVFLKGPHCGREVTEAQTSFKGVYKMAADLHYDLPGSDQRRRLVVFERRP